MMSPIQDSRKMWLMRFSSVLFVLTACGSTLVAADRPNILWISCEDISPNLGCYGDPHASTPNLDKLATEGARFTRAFTHAPVCAIVRSGIITGVYPVSIGSQHMRSNIVPPPHIRCFTEYLRADGYFCTNRSKTDYQFTPPTTAWDRQGDTHSDWRERGNKDQPFFSVVNLKCSHESQIRHSEAVHKRMLANLKPEQRHDPDKCASTMPKYLPDTPAARKNWAWYHDNISEMDRQAGELLQRLEDDGLADNTIVVFWSDHGMGLPRGKRWPYDSGTHVPVIVRWPGTINAGSVREDLVTTMDFPTTMLSLAGLEVPDYMHGRVFLGDETEPAPKHLFFHRDRMDEALEMIRAVRDNRFRYIRNFESEKPYAQGIDYMDEMPAMQDWRRLNYEGKLTGGQKNWFAREKPVEELYDLETDPHELNNLATNPAQADRLNEFRRALSDWQVAVRDTGLIPEPVLMHSMRPKGKKQRTADVQIQQTNSDANGVSLTCDTPGASIAYAIVDRNGKPENWSLYVKPVSVPKGSKLVTKACRIGFRDSSWNTFSP
ncbi:MAG: sulfatase [Planctomycetaceae bacterium]